MSHIINAYYFPSLFILHIDNLDIQNLLSLIDPPRHGEYLQTVEAAIISHVL